MGAAAACGGSQGAAGSPGAQGEAGAQGDPGTAGTAGAAGAAGEAGATGAQGPAGEAGATGAQGPAGEAGAQGAPGEAGAAGPVVVVSESSKKGLDISPVPLNLTGLSSAQIEMVGNGSYIVNALADCSGCHGQKPAFLGGGGCTSDGGQPSCTGLSFTVPVPTTGPDGGATTVTMTVAARNLTPDTTTGLKLTEDEFITAIRTGADYHTVSDAGAVQQTLFVMPWMTFRWMSLYDLQSIWRYLQAIPPVVNAVPADNKSMPPPAADPELTAYTAGDQGGSGTPLPRETVDGTIDGTLIPDPGFVLRGLALNPLTQVSTGGMDTSTLTAFGRGAYLVNAQADCSGCHTNLDNPLNGSITTAVYLTGGRVFDYAALGIPSFAFKGFGYVRSVSKNLVGKTNGFFNQSNVNYATFEGLITQGVHVEDTGMRVAFPMPVQSFKDLTITDMQAIYTYMKAVATQYGVGGDAGLPQDKVIPDPAIYCDTSGTSNCPTGYTCGDGDAGVAPHECFKNSCNVAGDCAICQACTGAGGHCAPMSPTAFGACVGNGL